MDLLRLAEYDTLAFKVFGVTMATLFVSTALHGYLVSWLHERTDR
jgi:hypothetical protein